MVTKYWKAGGTYKGSSSADIGRIANFDTDSAMRPRAHGRPELRNQDAQNRAEAAVAVLASLSCRYSNFRWDPYPCLNGVFGTGLVAVLDAIAIALVEKTGISSLRFQPKLVGLCKAVTTAQGLSVRVIL